MTSASMKNLVITWNVRGVAALAWLEGRNDLGKGMACTLFVRYLCVKALSVPYSCDMYYHFSR